MVLVSAAAKAPKVTAESKHSDRYNARDAEARWQKDWDERSIFATKNADPRPKYYVVEMNPRKY
jgi:valyl-tRNA synthetase